MAHLACAALVATDLWARTLRVQMMIRTLGIPLRFRDAMTFTAFGDAAAALTPLRLGGEVGRAFGARMAGVPLTVTVAVLGVESVIVYALAALAGAWLAAAYGGAWLDTLRHAGFTLSPRAQYAATVVVLLGLLMVLAVPAARYWIGEAFAALRAAVRAAMRIPPLILAWCLALSTISLVARVAILPVLALSVAPVDVGVVSLASFTLLHSQMAIPTPAGAGPIELAFMKDALGLRGHAGVLVGAWRLHVTVIPVVLGLTLGLATYGTRALRHLFPRKERHEY